jgi:hypothetical protein
MSTEPPETTAVASVAIETGARLPRPRRLRRALARWWVFTTRPVSVRALWRASGVVNTRRVPGASTRLAAVWWWSNRLDRVALVVVASLLLLVAGALLWCTARPSRRAGLYVVAAGLLVALVRAGG